MSWKDVFGGGSSNVPWKHLNHEDQIRTIVEASKESPQLIFKHSTRCSISSMAKTRLEREWNLENVEPWHLDLIAFRSVSNAIASLLGVHHESPQAILLKDGVVVHVSTHSAISAQVIGENI